MSIEAPASIVSAVASSTIDSSVESISSGLSGSFNEASFSFNPSLEVEVPSFSFAPDFSINTPSVIELTNPFNSDSMGSPIQHALLPDLFAHTIAPEVLPNPTLDQYIPPTKTPPEMPVSILDSLRQQSIIELSNPFTKAGIDEQSQSIEDEELSVKKSYEDKIDNIDINDVISQIKSNLEYSQDEKNYWRQKFSNLREEKSDTNDIPKGQNEVIQSNELELNSVPVPLAATQTIEQSSNKVRVLSSTGIDSGIPNKPKTPNATSENEPKPEEKTKEPRWDKFAVIDKINIAQKTLKKRYRLAQDMVTDSLKSSESNRISLVDNIFKRLLKFEMPDVEEFGDIIRGKLDMPTIIPRAEIELSIIQEDDEKTAQKALVIAIESALPTEKVQEEVYEGREKQSELPEVPRELANHGAKSIVLERGVQWIEIDPRKSIEPIELEIVEEVA